MLITRIQQRIAFVLVRKVLVRAIAMRTQRFMASVGKTAIILHMPMISRVSFMLRDIMGSVMEQELNSLDEEGVEFVFC